MSPAFSFKGSPKRGDFWKLILSGEKIMTTRGVRKAGGPRVGQTAHLYWKMRVPAKDKPIHLIGRSKIIRVDRYDNMKSLLLSLGAWIMHYVKQEGFADLRELVEWWTGISPSGYGVMEGGVFLDSDSWDALESSGPVEVIQWAYPLTAKGES